MMALIFTILHPPPRWDIVFDSNLDEGERWFQRFVFGLLHCAGSYPIVQGYPTVGLSQLSDVSVLIIHSGAGERATGWAQCEADFSQNTT